MAKRELAAKADLWRSPENLAPVLRTQAVTYPAMTVQDVYKLLYQAVRGPEHLIASPEDFAARLRAEYGGVTGRGVGRVWEHIRPDEALVRFHLRPFKAKNGDVERLIAACLETAARPWGTPELLRAAWAAFVEFCRTGWQAFPLQDTLAFAAWLEANDYPAVHHSEPYRRAYQPAYRLVDSTLLAELL